MSLNIQKSVLITGCSVGGYGEELARQFHENGLLVIATARTESSMAPLKALNIHTLTLDIADSQSIERVREEVTKLTNGKLDILINNAGAAYPYAATDFSMDDVKSLFDVNLFGAMAMVQKFVPLLIASGDGRIVQIGALAGVMPVPFLGAYAASKAALHSFGDTLRVELAPFNVKVITVISGPVKTNIVKLKHELPPGSLYQPIHEDYLRHRLATYQTNTMPREPVMRAIVAETLKVRPRAWLWVGPKSWLCWFIATFLGRRAFDRLVTRLFSLDKLARLYKEQKYLV